MLISRFRINKITAQFYKDSFVSDKWGGFKRSAVFKPKREYVMKFINKLQCLETRYCREQCQSKADNVPVKLSYFREIFNTKYNLGFCSPRTDVCSTCLSVTERIKREVDVAKNNDLITEKRVHRFKFKTFYEKLQDPDEKNNNSVIWLSEKSTTP